MSSSATPLSYRDAGVDIDAGDALVDRIKPHARRTLRPGVMAGIGAAAQKHIGDLLEMHEKNMVVTADIQRRKKLADDAFARRFDDVMRKHNAADYVKQG